MRSCGGSLAAAWQLADPARPDEHLEDTDYVTTARALLGQDLAAGDRRTCRCKRSTGPNAGEPCGAALCRRARHAYRCAVGGGLKTRTGAVERVFQCIHEECGYNAETQPHVPEWDRWHYHCTNAACADRGVAWTPPAASCSTCGAPRGSSREEAFLALEVRNAEVPRLYLDVTVRHPVTSDAARLRRNADDEWATNKEAEGDKRSRYPAERCPYKALPLATETFGRHGRETLQYLRKLARKQASRLEEDSDAVRSSLVLRWGCRLSVALHRANAANLRRCLGSAGSEEVRGRELACAMAG